MLQKTPCCEPGYSAISVLLSQHIHIIIMSILFALGVVSTNIVIIHHTGLAAKSSVVENIVD